LPDGEALRRRGRGWSSPVIEERGSSLDGKREKTGNEKILRLWGAIGLGPPPAAIGNGVAAGSQREGDRHAWIWARSRRG